MNNLFVIFDLMTVKILFESMQAILYSAQLSSTISLTFKKLFAK